jgi:hypothetical protein
MTIDKILASIEDKANSARGLAIDELADLFESDHLSEAEKMQAVSKLLQMVDQEEELFVIETIYNMFGIAFIDNICSSEIAQKCADMLHQLEPGSLVHALPIIAESDLSNRKELIIQYLSSENPAVEKVARESLQQLS